MNKVTPFIEDLFYVVSCVLWFSYRYSDFLLRVLLIANVNDIIFYYFS